MHHTGTIPIQTERLVLRQFTMEDVKSVYTNYGSDPLVNRYISFAPCAELSSTESFIQMHIAQYASSDDFYGWAITYENQVIGSIGLFNVDDGSDSAELGYSIGSRWWHKGLATEAAKAVLQYAFEVVGMHRIYASHHIDNLASGRVLQKIGMQYEGRLRDGQKNKDGTYADLILYGILATDKFSGNN